MSTLSQDESWSLAQLGYTLMRCRRDEEADVIFKGLAQLGGPQAAYAYHAMGLMAARRGELDRASALQQQALRLENAHPAARLALAEVLLRQGQRDTALQWLASIETGAGTDPATARRAEALRRKLKP